MTLTETPMQRERARTIYEKSKPGRRAAVLPEAGVPETPIEELIPAGEAIVHDNFAWIVVGLLLVIVTYVWVHRRVMHGAHID